MNIKARARGEEGAAAVEFALIVGVLAMLIFGMLQFGVAFFELQNLRSATRESSRVGAVRGTVSDMQGKITELTGVQPSAWGTSLHIQTITGNGQPQDVSDPSAKPCAPATGTPPDTVRTMIDLSNPSLPSGLKNIFSVDIPLMPSIPIRAAVFGDFRCEN